MLSFIMRNVIMLRVVLLNIVCSVSWRPLYIILLISYCKETVNL